MSSGDGRLRGMRVIEDCFEDDDLSAVCIHSDAERNLEGFFIVTQPSFLQHLWLWSSCSKVCCPSSFPALGTRLGAKLMGLIVHAMLHAQD
jgi:hypothetical protein